MGSELVAAGTLPYARKPRTASADELWSDIVSGRLLVLRHKDENGRRYLYVRPAPGGRDAENLTERERQVVSFRANGEGLKRIAHELGVSVPTVTRCLARAIAKLGLSSDMDLPTVFAAGLRERRRG